VEPPVVTEVVRNQYVPEIRYVTQYVTEYIPVPEPYEVEVIKEVPVELSQFESEAELASYLKWYKQNVIIVPLLRISTAWIMRWHSLSEQEKMVAMYTSRL